LNELWKFYDVFISLAGTTSKSANASILINRHQLRAHTPTENFSHINYNTLTILPPRKNTKSFPLIASSMAATSLEGSYDGYAPFTYPAIDKPLQTYYRVFGDLKSNITPLVCIHGGPGFCHNYLLNHSILTSTDSIPVIFYDQIGSGLSTRLPETASTPELWTEEIFFEQLRQLLNHLGIEKRYDILGSSWGGMLGSAFASTQPDGLRKLILANSAASKELSIQNRKRYRKMLPKEMQDVLDRNEAAGTWHTKEVGVVLQEFMRRHACNVVPWPEDMMASIRLSDEDRTVVHAM
jgi:proline-specific peptidase